MRPILYRFSFDRSTARSIRVAGRTNIYETVDKMEKDSSATLIWVTIKGLANIEI
ncbi:hypothetical protein [Leptospira wolbachii]|uniref:hypothetical protein n=1 Tax=Leptospira wolbachii TaxID=29511 RepID=UPI0012EBAF57|nr:hypothetical protein [Leptospira wolbachii]